MYTKSQSVNFKTEYIQDPSGGFVMPGPFFYTVNWRPDIGNMRVIYELTAWNQVGDAQDNVKVRIFHVPIEPDLLAQSMTGQEFLAYMVDLFFIRVPELNPNSN